VKGDGLESTELYECRPESRELYEDRLESKVLYDGGGESGLTCVSGVAGIETLFSLTPLDLFEVKKLEIERDL